VPDDRATQQKTDSAQGEDRQLVQPPTISLPKGGGAIRGIGEKFAANPVTGTGSMSVPIATSPGRSGFGPQLSLSYDSGSGNSTFGFGWSLSLPSITRKTAKGLPKYHEADESDLFILSGAEDLVPVLVEETGAWKREVLPPRTVGGNIYRIQRYRPRVEGLFARIERWTNQNDPADSFWRSISKDNVTTWYGKSSESRIYNPTDPSRIFSWLICETHDDKGNVLVYRYKAEDSAKLDLSQAHERNRTNVSRSSARYLKRIRYGNRKPFLPVISSTDPLPSPPGTTDTDTSLHWMFETVFDYGEHDATVPLPTELPAKPWGIREDPFSTYHAGFEERTYRLCKRVLMFHHFPEDPNVGNNCLVRSTDFAYSSDKTPADRRNPIYSFLLSASQTGYKRKAGGYLSKSLPPVEFTYSEPIVRDAVEEVDAASLANLPTGVDGTAYQWIDVHGEGIPGILTEQAGAWYYKRNVSPIAKDKDKVEFASVELLATKPNVALAGGQAQFMDLAGDGQPDVVVMEGPMPGFYEHDLDESWQPYRAFTSRLNRDMRDPNLKFVDLDGDGHADVLISEDDAFIWHASLGEEGFGPAQRVAQALDEEKGPRLVFADGTQSIYLADMSGDGLTDLVRIRRGDVCYWPNLGYCRFGAKVTMDHAPTFDHPDQFNHSRIRLADIDGSGSADIIYLHRDGVQLYFNQSGNSWSDPQTLRVSPRVNDLVSIAPTDLLGNGTACLVWSSPLPGDARRPMRYVNLMGGQKPHLLIKTINNLGAETQVDYAPSTKFYLQDKRDGKPWITKLMFPVHVVEKVTVIDKWRKTRFASTYSYHHGYFDGVEREFRGFGRVEQIDVESYGEFAQGNVDSPYITPDKTLFQPPVKTTTWYHTGAFIDRQRILSHYQNEYFPNWLTKSHPGLKITFAEHTLPEPDLAAENLNASEWREALRACKGMMLRQEVVELDVDALERPGNPQHLPVKLFSTAYHNCHIRRVQAQAENRFAVFLVAESEAITYQYELDLRASTLAALSEPKTLKPDPRIAHTLNLQWDDQANVLQSVAVVYPRIGAFDDASLNADQLKRIRDVQSERHLAYSETRYTADFGAKPEDKPAALDNHRLRVPCEVLSYELTGIPPNSGSYFTLEELRAFQLSKVHQKSGTAVSEIPYHQFPPLTGPTKRLVEHARTLFFAEDLVKPLKLGDHGRLGLTYEAYKLALIDALLNAIFIDVATAVNKLDQVVDADGVTTARKKLNQSAISGYLCGAELTTRFDTDSPNELAGQYWMRSGIAGFATDAAAHFYLPEKYTDPFGNVTTLEYDRLDLFIASSEDAIGNKTSIAKTGDKFHFDYRVLAPREMQDINANLSEVYFDILGLPAAVAVKGKGAEGDNLIGLNDDLANPALTELAPFFDQADLNEVPARQWLGNATARHVYYFGEIIKNGKTVWGVHPACACGIVREQHVSQLVPGALSPIQAAFEFSDGMGSVIVKKVQAEPERAGQKLRWVGNGRTILNNKGKPVKQYEPDFSAPEIGHRYDEPPLTGVTSVIYYDAAGRVVRTEMPDGTYSRVEFSPWHVSTFDQNDTVKDPGNAWFVRNSAGTAEQKRASQLAAEHANTPSLTILDSLGRDVIAIAHNRVKDAADVLKDEKYLTFTKLDAEGKPLWIRDARGNLVMQYITPAKANNDPNDAIPATAIPCYDIAGNLLFQHSMDAGDRWMINDAAGKPMVGWNSRGFITYVKYDELHRPTGSFVIATGNTALMGTPRNPLLPPDRPVQFEMIVYGEGQPNDTIRNLRGKPYQHKDTAGVVQIDGYDFKGNPVSSTRQLIKDYKSTPDWSQSPTLETEIFTKSARFDALNRPIQLIAPHSNQVNTKLNIIQPSYNEANLLDKVNVWLNQNTAPTTLLNPTTANFKAVTNIDYDAKGQRIKIEYNEAGNLFFTQYEYDKQTFRLNHLLTARAADRRALQDLSYTYDPVGNITEIRDAAQQEVYFKNTRITPSNAYIYDALYRLIHAEGREHAAQNSVQRDDKKFVPIHEMPDTSNPEALQRYTEVYDYDAVGNILGWHHTGGGTERWVRWYQYALDSNRLIATRSPGESTKLPFYAATPGYNAKYTYDAHGNMAKMPHLPLMEWDFKDQLHATQQQVVSDGGTGEKTYYVYDGSGERVRKITETQSGKLKDERIYLGGFEVYRKYNGASSAVELERESLHIMDDKQRIALVETRTLGNEPLRPQTIRYQLRNHLGSAVLEVDEQAQVITYEEYHPYGTTAYCAGRSAAEVSLKGYRYTGKERDEETGFSYHSARYYFPWLGRWASCDPIQQTNLFVYGNNNPVMLVDVDGKNPVSDFIANAGRSYEGAKTTILKKPFAHSVAEFFNIQKHTHQGKSIWLNGVRQTESEHLFPRKAVEFLGTAGKRWYENAQTVLLPRVVALNKTHRPGGDNAISNALVAGVINAKEAISRLRGNAIRSVADHWAQTGQTAFKEVESVAKHVGVAENEAGLVSKTATRAGQLGAATLGSIFGVLRVAGVAAGVLSAFEFRKDVAAGKAPEAIEHGASAVAGGFEAYSMASGGAVAGGTSAGLGTAVAIAPVAATGAAAAGGLALGAGGGIALEKGLGVSDYTSAAGRAADRAVAALGGGETARTVAGVTATLAATALVVTTLPVSVTAMGLDRLTGGRFAKWISK
jgi:RHS repeat-associated protein